MTVAGKSHVPFDKYLTNNISIPKRRELVKEAARIRSVTEIKETQKEQLAHRWSTCPVSHKPLVKPIVSDYTGELYNKDAIIQFLLPSEASSIDKVEFDKFIQGRIKSLKDVVEVNFEIEVDEKTKSEKKICPVTSKELGPSTKAVYIVPCGHAFSSEAIKEMKGDQCVQCATNYEIRDVVPILPSTEIDQEFVKNRMEALSALGLAHSLKKISGSKKRKNNGILKNEVANEKETPGQQNSTDLSKTITSNLSRSTTPQSGTSTPKISNGIKNAATASLTAKVLEEEEARKKRRTENANISSLYSKKDNQHKLRDGDFMTRGFSIPANAQHR